MDIAKVLSGCDRRSIGRSAEVVAHALKNKSILQDLVAALSHGDVVVRMRAADTLEKVSAQKPDWLDPFAGKLLAVASASDEQEIRWHAAQMFSRLRFSNAQRNKAIDLLFEFLKDKSRITQAFALTALVDLAKGDPALRARVAPLVKRAAARGSPSVKARAKALERRLGKRNAI
jgi:hypothetical protein